MNTSNKYIKFVTDSLLPLAKKFAKLMGKTHRLPGKNSKAIAFIVNTAMGNYDEAEKCLRGVDKWNEKLKHVAIDLLGTMIEKEYQTWNSIQYENIRSLWIKATEKGLTYNTKNHQLILKATSDIIKVRDEKLLMAWVLNQKFDNKTMHEVASYILITNADMQTKKYDEVWGKFQEKYIDDLNPDYKFGRSNYYTMENNKFILIALMYGPESLCFKMINKTNYIDEKIFSSIWVRKSSTPMKMIEMIANKSNGMEDLIKKIIKKHEKYIRISEKDKIEKVYDLDSDILDRLNYLSKRNSKSKIGSLLKTQWIGIMAEKEKEKIKSEIMPERVDKKINKKRRVL